MTSLAPSAMETFNENDTIITKSHTNSTTVSDLGMRRVSEPALNDFLNIDTNIGQSSTPKDQEDCEIFPWECDHQAILDRINNTSVWSNSVKDSSDMQTPPTRNTSQRQSLNQISRHATKILHQMKQSHNNNSTTSPNYGNPRIQKIIYNLDASKLPITIGVELINDRVECDECYGLKVSKIIKDGIAYNEASLQLNNSIIEINNISLIGMKTSKCKEMLKSILNEKTPTLTLSVLPNTAPPIPSVQPPDMTPGEKASSSYSRPSSTSSTRQPLRVEDEAAIPSSTANRSSTPTTPSTLPTPTTSTATTTSSTSSTKTDTKIKRKPPPNPPSRNSSTSLSTSSNLSTKSKQSVQSSNSLPSSVSVQSNPPTSAITSKISIPSAKPKSTPTIASAGSFSTPKSAAPTTAASSSPPSTPVLIVTPSKTLDSRPNTPITKINKINDPTNTMKIGSLITINLLKGNDGLGFSITSRDVNHSHQCPIYIKKILPKGAAIKDNRLQIGDRLIRFNGNDMTTKSQKEAVTLLLSAKVGDNVELVVSRQIGVSKSGPSPSGSNAINPARMFNGEREIGESTPVKLPIQEREIGGSAPTTSSKRIVGESAYDILRKNRPQDFVERRGSASTTSDSSNINEKINKELSKISAERPTNLTPMKTRKQRPSSTVGFLHSPAADATFTMTNRTSALLDDNSPASDQGEEETRKTQRRSDVDKSSGKKDVNTNSPSKENKTADDDLSSSDEDLSASFTRSFQRESLARQSMSLKRNKLSNGTKDPRLEKLYAKVKEVRQKEQEKAENVKNNNTGMSHYKSSTLNPRMNPRSSNEESMSKSASMKCRLVRTRGKNDSFRAAVDHSYNDSRTAVVAKTAPSMPCSPSTPSLPTPEKSTATVIPSVQSTERPRSISASSASMKKSNFLNKNQRPKNPPPSHRDINDDYENIDDVRRMMQSNGSNHMTSRTSVSTVKPQNSKQQESHRYPQSQHHQHQHQQPHPQYPQHHHHRPQQQYSYENPAEEPRPRETNPGSLDNGYSTGREGYYAARDYRESQPASRPRENREVAATRRLPSGQSYNEGRMYDRSDSEQPLYPPRQPHQHLSNNPSSQYQSKPYQPPSYDERQRDYYSQRPPPPPPGSSNRTIDYPYSQIDPQTRTLPLPPRNHHQQPQQHYKFQHQQQQQQSKPQPPQQSHRVPANNEPKPSTLPHYRTSNKHAVEQMPSQMSSQQQYSRYRDPDRPSSNDRYTTSNHQPQKLVSSSSTSSSSYRNTSSTVYDHVNNGNQPQRKSKINPPSHRELPYVDPRHASFAPSSSTSRIDPRQYPLDPRHTSSEHPVNQNSASYATNNNNHNRPLNDYYGQESKRQQSQPQQRTSSRRGPAPHGQAPPPHGYEPESSSTPPAASYGNHRTGSMGATSAFWNYNKMPSSSNNHNSLRTENYANVYHHSNERGNDAAAPMPSNTSGRDLTSSLYGKHSAPSMRTNNGSNVSNASSVSQFRGYIPPHNPPSSQHNSNPHYYASSDISKAAQV